VRGARAVLASELRQLVRDRRALFAAVLLPALLYPLIFWVSGALERTGRERLAAREVAVAADLERLDPDVAGRAREAIRSRAPLRWLAVDAGPLLELERSGPDLALGTARDERRARFHALVAEGGDVLLVGRSSEGPAARSTFTLTYEIKDESAREAVERVSAALGELGAELAAERRAALLGDDPARGLELVAVDVASARDAQGARLGRLLPLLALLVLVSGGSYAALAAFAGEREAGTLETLLVQPLRARSIVAGKFLAVLAAGLATLVANLASLAACVELGLAPSLGPAAASGSALGLARIASGIVYLPACVLLCAVLCLVCGRARTFRQGQLLLLPVLLLALVPTALALQPGVEASFGWALVPLAGPALALREALRGELLFGPTAVMVLSHAGWTALVLARLAGVLDAERALGGEPEDAGRGAALRHGQAWGFGAVLALIVLGGELQRRDLFWGLALTLWVLLPALAIACARRARRSGAGGLARELGLRAPSLAHALGALLLVPGLAHAVGEWILPLQERFLPLPAGALDARKLESWLASTPTALLLFLMALSPGVGEELFFRGALQSSLGRGTSAWRAVAWQAAFFAAAHASIYRLIPTGLVGLVLGALTVRARSILPAVILHTGYDAWQVLRGLERLPEGWEGRPWTSPWLALVGLALLTLRASRSEADGAPSGQEPRPPGG